MNWSIKVAQVAGIPIRVHLTFILILALGAFQWAGRSGDTVAGALFGATLMILLFACVALHELGHSLAARLFGIPTKQILLMPLGGIAQLQRMPDTPWQQLVVALAGPAVNLLIALGMLLFIGISPSLSISDALLDGQGLNSQLTTDLGARNMLFWLLAANLSLVLFNLIPALPLDGGRVLRALLAMGLGPVRAMRIASVVGQVLAVGMGLWGILSGNIVLSFVAVFIFLGAGQEAAAETVKRVRVGRSVGEAYNKHVLTLTNGDRLSKVTEYILTSYQPDFAVVFGNRLLGIVTRDDVLRALVTHGNDVYVGEIMQREPLWIQAGLSLEEAHEQMMERGARVAAVQDETGFKGLISLEDIQEATTILTFARRHAELRKRTL